MLLGRPWILYSDLCSTARSMVVFPSVGSFRLSFAASIGMLMALIQLEAHHLDKTLTDWLVQQARGILTLIRVSFILSMVADDHHSPV